MLTLLLLTWLPMDMDDFVYVDQVEINTVVREETVGYGAKTRKVFVSNFDQIILWRWDKQNTREVAQWKVLGTYKDNEPTGERNVRIWEQGKYTYVIVWDNRERWQMRTESFHITGGTVDPEVKNRKVLRAEYRVPYFQAWNGVPVDGR